MKKYLLLLFSAFTVISCVEVDTNDYEVDPEPYKPKELRLKSISLKWHGNIFMKTEDTDFYYDQNGLLSTIEYFQVLETAEERQTRNFYYTGLLLDSIIDQHSYLFTSGPNEGNENKYQSEDYFFHNEDGLITDEENWANDYKMSHTKFFYEGDKLIKSIIYWTPHPPNKPHTTESNITYNSKGNVESAGDNRFIYDDMNTVMKNVYAPSLHRLRVNSKNNVLKFYYNTIGGFEEYKYTYNKDLYPETRKTYDGGKLIKTEVFTYY